LKGVFCFLLFSLPALALANYGSGPCSSALTDHIPSRPTPAAEGADFVHKVGDLNGEERERAIRDELLSGNLPEFLRDLTPVTLAGHNEKGEDVEIVFCVTPDYLAIGSDRDFLRIPMGLETAVTVASRFGFMLPTRKMVDAVYKESEAHLVPRPMTPGAEMVSTDYFARHDDTVDEQCKAKGVKLGELTSGHKKDLVLTNRLRAKPGRVAIYGWHQPGGKPIQPLSTVHGAEYADYSHGVRLVSEVVFVNGKRHSIFEVLQSPTLASILSDEGPIPQLARLVRDLGGQGANVRTAGVRRTKGGDS